MEQETPKLKDIRLIDGGWLNKYILTYELADGTLYEYESVSRKGPDEYRRSLEAHATSSASAGEADAVCIVPFLRDGSILLIKEFRYAVNGWVIAFPAGLIEPGEDIAECVNRELAEETGFQLRTDIDAPIHFLPQSGYSSVGMGDENVRVVVAQVEHAGEQNLQKGELIQIFSLSRDYVGTFLDKNRDLIGTRCQLILEALREPSLIG